MWLKYPIIIFVFFTLVLMQNSFLPYFSVEGVIPNVVFILFFILIFFEKRNEYYEEHRIPLFIVKLWQSEGLFTSVIAGFFLDLLSPSYLLGGRQFFGMSIISLLIIYFLTKTVVYFLIEKQDKYFIFYFLSVFLFSFFIYTVLLSFFSNYFYFKLYFNKAIFVSFLYNLIFTYCSFYIYKKFIEKDNFNNQLKLF